MKAKNQVYRGDGYLEQLVSFAEKLYSEFDNEFKVTLGFSHTTCQKIFIYVFQQYQYKSIDLFKKNFRLGKMIKTFIDTMLRNTKLLNQSISGGYVFRVYKKELYEVFDKEEIDAIISVLGRKLGDVSITYHNIGDLNPLCEKPIVNFDDYIYVPLPLLTLQNLPKLFHYYFIADKRFDKNTRAKYKKYRGDVIENLVISYLERLFDRKKIYHSLKYDIDKEADLTVQQSDVTLFCECKSKVLTLSSLQGDFDSIQSDFNKAIGESFKQAIRTKTWLSEDRAFFATDDNGNTHNVNLKSTRYKYVICIVAENFGWIPANIKDYLQPDELDNLLPVVSTIFDLDIITRECKNKFEFISYLQSRLDNFDKVSSMDELECFCLLKANGFQKIEIDSDILTPIGYTSEIDRKYHKLDTEWLFNYKM
ncbi:MAG: hypothetical protein A2Y23_08760 [Clostridiales bacterium GWB2_37_7]|nr:MAG: hypothetical protein A2Y23_08760 [Clostridiales bacterium GWB2_37_7]